MLPLLIPRCEEESRPLPGPSYSAGLVQGTAERTRKPRVLTDARKAQNRASQRAFRQRQRERKAGLASSRALTSPRCSLSMGSRNEILLSIVSRQHLSDPYTNALPFLPTSIFSAILRNAMCLDFNLSLLADCPTEEQMPSPFFRPSTPQDDPSTLIASVHHALPPSVPEHLKPTLAQVLFPHHACLDLIPLPALRERVIMLGAAMPFAYNLTELKRDIYERHGLTVGAHGQRRGGGGGGGDAAGDGDGTVVTSVNQPWDMRSWEAAPWFLRKWSMAVDGEGGELSKQSARLRALGTG